MKLDLTDEQSQLRESLARLLADEYAFEARRRIAASAEGFSRAAWARYAELGLTALPIAEADGGLGGNASDLAVVMEELGAALVLEPYLAGVLAARAIGLAGDAGARAQWLTAIAAGSTVATWAHDEPGARHAPLWVEAVARPGADGWRIDGAKAHVLHGGIAEVAVLSARIAGAPDAPQGLGLFLVLREDPGVACRAYRLLDGTPAATWTLSGARAVPLGMPGEAAGTIAQVRAIGIAALCAEALGATRAAFALTVGYLNTRKQFGRFIGENQALRHRVAEMHVALEACRSAAALAAIALDDPDACDPPRDLARAKLLIGRHARWVCQQAIQLHGGIGMTEEYAVGHSLRRITVIGQLMGDAESHLAALAALPDPMPA